MNSYILRDHIHVCRRKQSLVVLDLNADKYVGVSPEIDCSLSGLIEGWPADELAVDDNFGDSGKQTAIQTLIDADLVTASEGRHLERPELPPASDELDADSNSKTLYAAVFRMRALSTAYARAWLRLRGPNPFLEPIQQQQSAQTANLHALSPRRGPSVGAPEARAATPQFGWDHAHIHRVEPIS
jgi:hypothetical protein